MDYLGVFIIGIAVGLYIATLFLKCDCEGQAVDLGITFEKPINK